MNATRVSTIALLALLGATACSSADVSSTEPSAGHDPEVSTTAVAAKANASADARPSDAAGPSVPAPVGDTATPTTTAAQPAAPQRPQDPADPADPDLPEDDPDLPEDDPAPPPVPEADPSDVENGGDADEDANDADGPVHLAPGFLEQHREVVAELPDPDPDPGPRLPGVAGDLDLVGVAPDPGPIDVAVDGIVAVPDVDCGIGGIPADAAGVETMMIDVDDDGVADTVTTYFAALGDSAGWRLRVELANGPMDDIAIEGVGGAGYARILGGVQADWQIDEPATHRRELLVQAGANASGVNLAVFGLDEDECLFRFTDGGGADLVLPVHTSIGTMSGLMCDAVAGSAFLVRLHAQHADGDTYDATATRLDRLGHALVPGTVLDHEIDAVGQADWLATFGSLTCSGISL